MGEGDFISTPHKPPEKPRFASHRKTCYFQRQTLSHFVFLHPIPLSHGGHRERKLELFGP